MTDHTEAVTRARDLLTRTIRADHESEEARSVITDLLAAYDKVQRWKDQTIPIMLGLQDLGRALDVPLGTRITGESAAEQARALVAERDRAHTEVERVVKVLTDKAITVWWGDEGPEGAEDGDYVLVSDVLAVLEEES